MPHTFASYVAIGDSFTEGVGDELPDGRVRGWADLVALGLARSADGPVRYANLAIRGRLLGPIAEEQVPPAIALAPDLISFNGGGNDVLRPRIDVTGIADRIEAAVDQMTASGAHVLLATGANPTAHLPLGSVFQARGELLAQAVRDRMPKPRVTLADNWADVGLGDIRYWSLDKLHLNALGHARVAGNVLSALGAPLPADESDAIELRRPGTAAYWREYVLPWIGRRLTGRSSGDGRMPKIATLEPVELPDR